jgi:plastocyanin
MKNQANLWRSLLLLPLLVLMAGSIPAQQKKGAKYVCSESNPQSICTPTTTCGSPCLVDVKRTANSADSTPNIPGAKPNAPFCVKAGTTVTWHSTSKNTGFVVDFGPNSPFAQEAIIGGSEKQVSVVATKPGCYKFSAGACVTGAIYGMCAEKSNEVVVTAN